MIPYDHSYSSYSEVIVSPLVHLWNNMASNAPAWNLEELVESSIQCPLCSNVLPFNDYFTHLHDIHPISYQFWLYFSLPESSNEASDADHLYDVDRMSYEELLDLCQTIGNHTIGLTNAQKEDATVAYQPTPEESQAPPRCTICLTEATVNPGIVRLRQCGHVHCKECIYEWLTRHKTCPVCIQEVLPKNYALDSLE